MKLLKTPRRMKQHATVPHRERVDDLLQCPKCKADWRGALIPPEDRHLFGGKHACFSRLIGVELPAYDGVHHWECPDCGATFKRF